MTLRLMDSSIHMKQSSKGPGGVIWSICLLQDRVWLPCTVPQGLQRRNPLKHFASVQSQRSLFSSGKIALTEHNTPDPKGFLAACAKMKICEGRRLPHSHCSSRSAFRFASNNTGVRTPPRTPGQGGNIKWGKQKMRWQILKDTEMLLLEWWNCLGIYNDKATSVEMRRHKIFDGPNLKPSAVDEEFCCWSQLGLGEVLHKASWANRGSPAAQDWDQYDKKCYSVPHLPHPELRWFWSP